MVTMHQPPPPPHISTKQSFFLEALNTKSNVDVENIDVNPISTTYIEVP